MSKNMSNLEQASPFVSDDQLFLVDVINKLDTVEGISKTRRRDLKSAIRAVARLVGKSPEITPANINWLHIRLRRIVPVQHNISKKRFANIKSDALKALEVTGCSRERKDWLRSPSPIWQRLLDSTPTKQDQWKLTQLAQYCTALGVDGSTMRDFGAGRLSNGA